MVEDLLQLREAVKERIAQLERELDLYKKLLAVLEEAIGEKSFTTAAEEKERRAKKPLEVQILKSKEGEELGTAEIYEDEIVLRPKAPVKLEGVLRRFFLEKLLERYKEEDEEAVRRGEKRAALEYQVEEEGEAVRAIVVKNYGDENRRREIIRAFRWTLERALKA
ncbi:MAG: hypothetical protein ABWJ97_05970 [Thermoproteus sp.]